MESKLLPNELYWVEEKIPILQENHKKFPILFSQTSRYIENLIPKWHILELHEMEIVYPGFTKTDWTKQDLGRILLMLSLEEKNANTIQNFFEIAEMKELITLYKGLFFLDSAVEFSEQVKEGVRTNMVNVFDAICLGNPYAATYLEDAAWNQMILKAVFMERPLFKVQDIDKRRNKELAEMLQDYIKERWAAGREVSPEVWRVVHGYLKKDVKLLLSKRSFKDIENQSIEEILKESPIADAGFWDSIGKMNLTKNI